MKTRPYPHACRLSGGLPRGRERAPKPGRWAGGEHGCALRPAPPSPPGRSRQRQDEVKCYDTSPMTHFAIKERQSQRCFTTHLARLTPHSGVSCRFAPRCCQVFIRQRCIPACSSKLGRALKIASRSIIDRLETVLYVGPERIGISVRQQWMIRSRRKKKKRQ